VELLLEIRPNGTVASAMVVSGHPLLQQAALESAKQSQFECKNCNEGVRAYRLRYSFELGPTEYCTETSDSSKGNPTGGTLPASDSIGKPCDYGRLATRVLATWDSPAVAKKVRSAKCLYLWRCGHPRLVSYE